VVAVLANKSLALMPVAIEQHVEFVTDCIAHMWTHRLSSGGDVAGNGKMGDAAQ
jgi:hypothetical protein